MIQEKPSLTQSQRETIGGILHSPLETWDYVTSGAANHIFRAGSAKGETWIIKVSKVNQANLFECEAEALQRMAGTKTVHVPRVIHTAGDFLILEDLGTEGKETSREDWFNFGVEFGRMHRVQNPTFGYSHDNYIGIWNQINTPEENWIDFYFKYRVECYFESGSNKSILTSDDRRGIETIIKKMRDLVPDLKPSLCHGDFWMNNVFQTPAGKIFCIDPAIHFGHPEADLAMTRTYAVFPDAFFEGYNHSHGLLAGWQERLPLYQLKEFLLMIAQFEHPESLVALRDLIRKFE